MNDAVLDANEFRLALGADEGDEEQCDKHHEEGVSGGQVPFTTTT